MSLFGGATFTRAVSASIVVAATLAVRPAVLLAADEPEPGFLFNAETELSYDDNVYRTESDEQSDSILVLRPELVWVASWGAHQFDLGYQGDFGRYFNESDLDYNSNAIGARLQLDHSTSLRTDYTLAYQQKTDKPGSTDDLFLQGQKPIQWHNSQVGATLEYGSTDSQGQLVLQARYNEKRYTNNDQEYRDYDGTGGTATFYYRIAPRTRTLLEVDYTDYDYGNANEDLFESDQSGANTQLLAGVTWEATRKTMGVFKIGYRERSYEDGDLDSQSGLALFLDGNWRPNTFTKVIFGASRDNQNSGQRGSNGQVSTSGYIFVVRDISERTRLNFDVKYSNEDFDDFANRDDDRWNAGLGLEYSLVHWLDVGIAYRYQDRDSNVDVYDFSANTIMLTAGTRFGE